MSASAEEIEGKEFKKKDAAVKKALDAAGDSKKNEEEKK